MDLMAGMAIAEISRPAGNAILKKIDKHCLSEADDIIQATKIMETAEMNIVDWKEKDES